MLHHRYSDQYNKMHKSQRYIRPSFATYDFTVTQYFLTSSVRQSISGNIVTRQ